MNSLVDGINALFGALINLLNFPFKSFPVLGLIFISAVAGVIFLLMYGKVSNQKRIKAVKRGVFGALLEAIIFRHDVSTSLKAQGSMFWNGVRYFLIAIPPILILLVPCLLILSQLNFKFAYRPLAVNESALFTVKVADPNQLYRVSLEKVPSTIEVSPPLRIKDQQEIVWRITGKEPGVGQVEVKLGDSGRIVPWTVNVAAESGSELQQYAVGQWWWKFLYPAKTINGFGDLITETRLEYPEQSFRIFGIEIHWLIIFGVVSIASGLMSSRFLKVEI